MNSRSRKGKPITCIACREPTNYYVAILKNNNNSTQPHWFVCLTCYQQDKWQQIVDNKGYTRSIQPTKPKQYKRKPSKASINKAWDII